MLECFRIFAETLGWRAFAARLDEFREAYTYDVGWRHSLPDHLLESVNVIKCVIDNGW